MKKIIVLAAVLFTSVLTPSNAATEYIRFTGSADLFCIFCGVTLADFGWTEGQALYFDVMFDTAADSPLADDYAEVDYFAAVALAGTNAIGLTFDNNEIVGVTPTYPEGPVTWFRGFGSSLRLGKSFYDLPPFGGDVSIDTWTVGTQVFLYNPDGFSQPYFSLASLAVSYRGSGPPPPIPLPASVWLLMPALATLRLFGRRSARPTIG